MATDYHFAPTAGGSVQGFNDPVAANFSYEGNLTDSLVREAIQNVIDARLSEQSPVRAEFNLKYIPAHKLPNPNHLEQIFVKCADYADKLGHRQAVNHYRTQANVLKNNENIPMLCISDSNTCGLTGDNKSGRWFMFMRGIGINAGGASAGGVFGLGKGAFFANSLFKTIFASTVTDEGVKFAGKLRLLSFEQDREEMQGDGTFGLPGQLPVQKRGEIPELFNRSGKGTDIWVVNYLGSEDWENAICRAVLGWFWPAIHWGILTVKVGNKEINADNLRERMTELYSPSEKIYQKPFNPIHFFDSYTDPEKRLNENLSRLGEVSFYGRTSVELPLPNKTTLVRNTGMIIDFASRTAHLTKYAAVFECRNEVGSPILRKLENPAHTEWDWRNWKDEHGRYVEDGKIARNELEQFIGGALGKLLFVTAGQSTIIPGLADHLGIPTSDGTLPKSGVVNNLVQEPVEEETGIEIGSEDFDDNDVTSPPHIIKPVRVKRFVPVIKDFPPDLPPNPNPPVPDEGPFPPPIIDIHGKGRKLQELENAVVRYVVGEETTAGRRYRFIIHTDKKEGNHDVRMRLFARAEEGQSELLDIINAVGERGTSIIKKEKEYCDFSLDNSGKAYLSVELNEPWIVALEPNLRILLP